MRKAMHRAVLFGLVAGLIAGSIHLVIALRRMREDAVDWPDVALPFAIVVPIFVLLFGVGAFLGFALAGAKLSAREAVMLGAVTSIPAYASFQVLPLRFGTLAAFGLVVTISCVVALTAGGALRGRSHG